MNMIRFKFILPLMFTLLGGWQTAYSNILVIAPHPDDEIIISSGVIYAATQRGEQVTVVYMTSGDFNGLGDLRQDEAVDAQINNLGVRESDLIFLGYPDEGLETIYLNYPLLSDRFLSAKSGHTTTYAHRGLGGTDYHNFRFGSHADYNRFNLLKDLKEIINTQRPEHIITVTEADQHSDHRTTYLATRDAIQAVTATDPSYVPVLNKMMVWSTNSSVWPEAANPQGYFNEPPGLVGTGLVWSDRESLDVPLSMQVAGITNIKERAISAHISQGGSFGSFIGRFSHKDEFFWPVNVNGGNFPPRVNAGLDQTVAQGVTVVLNGSGSRDPDGANLNYQWRQVEGPTVTLTNATTVTPSFIAPSGAMTDTTIVFELRVNDGSLNTLPDHISVRVLGTGHPAINIAPAATVIASSQNISSNQQAVKAVDGVVDGYPGDYSKEWATVNQGAGAWLQLNWGSSYEINRVVLHDRPNLNENITGATLTFSNGTSVNVAVLNNAGAGVEINVGPLVTNSVRFTVTTVSGSSRSIGLSEIEVYGTAVTGGNLAPIANSGPNQTVGQGSLVNLNGNGSSDPNGDTLISYRWTQVAGPNVILNNSNTATPSFTAPVDLIATVTLKFSLVVNDGQVDSTPDTVDITVTAAASTGTNIAPLATVTASSQNFATNQQAAKAVDGVADGWPGDYTKEWATINGLTGSWLELNWGSFYQVSRVVLSDRPNLDEQITSATLTFSDGSKVDIGALNNAGAGVTVSFTPVLTTSIRVTVNTVSGTTKNIGLSEFQVFGAPTTTGNLAPTADAGSDQTVPEGSAVFLDGRASADPNSDPLTYLWTQTAGSAVNLIGANTSTPTFSAPTGLLTTTVLTFALVVNDSHSNSPVDSVNVAVIPATGANAGTNIAPLAAVTASSQNFATNQQAVNVADGVVDGWPGDYTKEWATINGLAGSWLELTWGSFYQVSRVVLYDRPSLDDQIISATLTFSNGSTVTVGALNNAGAGVTINFTPVQTNSIRITVTTVSGTTRNIGLAEFQVYGVPII